MTSHLNSHRTTEIKPEMLSGVQTGNGTPHDKYKIRSIAHAWTNRKDDIFMQRRLVQNFTFILEWGQGTFSWTKHTWRWAYSRYFFPLCCLLRFAAFLTSSWLVQDLCMVWYDLFMTCAWFNMTCSYFVIGFSWLRSLDLLPTCSWFV